MSKQIELLKKKGIESVCVDKSQNPNRKITSPQLIGGSLQTNQQRALLGYNIPKLLLLVLVIPSFILSWPDKDALCKLQNILLLMSDRLK